MALPRFLRSILRWLRRQKAPEVVGQEIARAPHASLWSIPSDEPGVIACWLLNVYGEYSQLVVSLVSIAALRQDVALGKHYQRHTDPFRTAGKSFSAQLDLYLQTHGQVDSRFASHIVIVCLRSTIPAKHSKSRRPYTIRPVANVPGDLQGVSSAWATGDRYALQVGANLMRQLLSKSRPSVTAWETLVRGLNWVDLVEANAKRVIGEPHVLQPRVTRSTRE